MNKVNNIRGSDRKKEMTLVLSMTEPDYDFENDGEIRSPEPTIPCQLCTKKFSSHQNLLIHQIIKHQLLPYKCTKKNCGKSFLTSPLLEAHIASIHTKKSVEKPVQKLWKCTASEKCAINGKSFDTEIGLKKHMKRHGEKTLKCDECDKAFFEKPELDAHKRVHSKKRPYSCPRCSKSFTSMSSKKYHEDNVACTSSL